MLVWERLGLTRVIVLVLVLVVFYALLDLLLFPPLVSVIVS